VAVWKVDESVSLFLSDPDRGLGSGIKKVFDSTVEATCEVLGTDAAAIGLLDGDHVTLRSYRGLSDRFATRLRVHKHDGLTGLVFRSGQPYATRDQTFDPNHTEESTHEKGIRGTLHVPLKLGNEVIGFLYVGHRSPRDFSVREIRIASALGEQVSKSLENAHLLEQERRHRHRAETLLEVVDAAKSSLGLKKVLAKLCESVVDLSVGDRCSIYLIDEEAARLEAFMSVGVKDPALWEKSRSFGRTMPKEAVDRLVSDLRARREPAIADDVRISRLVSPRWVKAFGLKSMAMYPLMAKDKVIGVMVVDAFRDYVHFPPEEVETLTAVANQAAVIIDNARLFEEERRQRERAALLLDVVTNANSSVSLKKLLVKLGRSVVDLSVAQRCSIFLVYDEGTRLEPLMSLGVEDKALWEKFHALGSGAPRGRVSRLMTALNSLREPYVEEDVRGNRVLPRHWAEAFDVKSVVIYPLLVKDELIGIMVVDAFSDQVHFPPEEVETLKAIANQAAVIIEHARLLEQERSERERAEHLLEVVSAAAPTLSLRKVVIKICEAVVKLSVADRCSIFLRNEDTGRSEPYMSLGVEDPELWQRFQNSDSVSPEDVRGLEEAFETLTPAIEEHVPGSGFISEHWIDAFALKSLAVYPLLARDKPVGTMAVDSFRDFVHFPPEEVEALTAIARQIAIIIENARLFEKEHRQRDRAEWLLEVLNAASSSLSLKSILIKLCQSVVDFSVGDRCTIYLIDREAARLVPYMSLGIEDASLWQEFEATGREAPSGRTSRLIEALSKLRQPYVDEDVRRSRVLPPSWIETFDLKSVVLYPLIVKDAVMGVMVVDAFRDYAHFPPEEVETLAAVAKQAAILIENARLYENMQAQAVTDFLTGVHNHRYLRDRLEEELARTNRGGLPFSIMMLDLDQFALFNDTYGHPAGDAVLHNVASTIASACRATDILGRYGGDEFMVILPQTNKTQAKRLGRRIQSRLGQASFRIGDVGAEVSVTVSIGVASCPEDGDRGERLILEADAALYESKRRGGNDVSLRGRPTDSALPSRGSTQGIIQSLVKALGEKEPHSRDHFSGAARYAVLMAEALGLSDEEKESLRKAALLHDIGKLAIPDRILLKSGPLSRREWPVVRKHVLLGEAILRGIPELADAAPAVVSHHERWDGRGYPRRLQGEDIPLLGRIIAVVDAFSAMTSERPFRKAMSHRHAVRELKSNAGTQFDPRLVDVFLELIKKERLPGRVDSRSRAA
jgi:diguanylate cyclase (GGDEF)-like protein